MFVCGGVLLLLSSLSLDLSHCCGFCVGCPVTTSQCTCCIDSIVSHLTDYQVRSLSPIEDDSTIGIGMSMAIHCVEHTRTCNMREMAKVSIRALQASQLTRGMLMCKEKWREFLNYKAMLGDDDPCVRWQVSIRLFCRPLN